MNKFKKRPVKAKTLTAENSSWARILEMRKEKKLLSATKHKIETPEPVKPAVGVPPAPLTSEQREAAARLDFAASKRAATP